MLVDTFVDLPRNGEMILLRRRPDHALPSLLMRQELLRLARAKVVEVGVLDLPTNAAALLLRRRDLDLLVLVGLLAVVVHGVGVDSSLLEIASCDRGLLRRKLDLERVVPELHDERLEDLPWARLGRVLEISGARTVLGRDRSFDAGIEANEDAVVALDADDANGDDETVVESRLRLSREHREDLDEGRGGKVLASLGVGSLHLVANAVEGESLGDAEDLGQLAGKVVEGELVELARVVVHDVGDGLGGGAEAGDVLLVVLHRIGGHLPRDVVVLGVDASVVENVGLPVVGIDVPLEVGAEEVLGDAEEGRGVDEDVGREDFLHDEVLPGRQSSALQRARVRRNGETARGTHDRSVDLLDDATGFSRTKARDVGEEEVVVGVASGAVDVDSDLVRDLDKGSLEVLRRLVPAQLREMEETYQQRARTEERRRERTSFWLGS